MSRWSLVELLLCAVLLLIIWRSLHPQQRLAAIAPSWRPRPVMALLTDDDVRVHEHLPGRETFDYDTFVHRCARLRSHGAMIGTLSY